MLGTRILQLDDLLPDPRDLQLQRSDRARVLPRSLADAHLERPEAQHLVPQQVLEDKLGELGTRAFTAVVRERLSSALSAG